MFVVLLLLSSLTLQIHGAALSDNEDELLMHPRLPSTYDLQPFPDTEDSISNLKDHIGEYMGHFLTGRERVHRNMYMVSPSLYNMAPHYGDQVDESLFWKRKAQESVKRRVKKKRNENVAKNVIMFLGDGMSINTITAGREYIRTHGDFGETDLTFDNFPYTGLSKTYCVDKQVADSAVTATAYLTGVKANYQTIGVTSNVEAMACEAAKNEKFHTDSIATWSQARGKRTGFVTTARVTHASPAAIYAHTSSRFFESDSDVLYHNKSTEACSDIASQLVHSKTGKNLNVIMGGGRAKMLPTGVPDGKRSDGKNLVEEWINEKAKESRKAKYVKTREELLNLPDDVDYVMGLFNESHLSYNLDRQTDLEPSLEEMVEAAIKILSKEPKGYFLFVEGAKIDIAHHHTTAHIALDEVSELSKAVRKAVDLTKEEDTLIVVTSDHAHAMSYNGYPDRTLDVLGASGLVDTEKMGYMILSYANGPGYRKPNPDGSRTDVTRESLNKHFLYPSMIPLEAETHGGDDVAVFARGPWSHLFTGVMEQNVIPHLMAYASCVGVGTETTCMHNRMKNENLNNIEFEIMNNIPRD